MLSKVLENASDGIFKLMRGHVITENRPPKSMLHARRACMSSKWVAKNLLVWRKISINHKYLGCTCTCIALLPGVWRIGGTYKREIAATQYTGDGMSDKAEWRRRRESK